MARKQLTITIDQNGKRDAGKVFVLTEMSASRGEKWALKIFIALGHAGVFIPENLAEMGIQGVALMGIIALEKMTFDDAEPILDEMMGYVAFMPDPSKPEVVRALVENDIEEISTRLKLRKKLFSLNLDFFGIAVP